MEAYSLRPKKGLSFEHKRWLLVSFKAAISMGLGGIIVIFWSHFTMPIATVVQFLPLVVILFANVSYSLPTIVMFMVEFVLAVAISCFGGFLTFYILDKKNPNPPSDYYGIFLIFFYAFFLSAADRNRRHVMFVKLSVVFYGIISLVTAIPSINIFGHMVLWVMVYSVLLGGAAAILVSCLICPLFPSQLIIPSLVEFLEDSRNMYATMSLYLVTLDSKYKEMEVAETPGYNHLENKDCLAIKLKLKKQETALRQKMTTLNTYFQQSAIETWDKERIETYGAVRDKLSSLFFLLLAMRKLITRDDFVPVSNPLHILQPAHAEILKFWDLMINQASEIHGVPQYPAEVNGWPTPDSMVQALADIHDAYANLIKTLRETKVVMPSDAVMRNASLMVGIQGLIANISEINQSFGGIQPLDKMYGYKHIVKGITVALFAATKKLYDNLDYGIISGLKKKEKSFKEKLVGIYKSMKWRFPLIYSICVGTTYAWLVYLENNHAKTLHIDSYNRSWLLVTSAILIVPTLGGSISRCIHRITGTAIGACTGFLLGWAMLSAGEAGSTSRWVAVDLLFVAFSFIGVFIQQIPGTGYAAVIGTLTVFLIPGPFLQSSLSRPPVYIFVTRILFISASSFWQALIVMSLIPPKSVNNLEASLIDGMCTAGKAFATMIQNGVLQDNGSECNFDEKTRTQVIGALKAMGTSYNNMPLLLQDSMFEGWMLRKNHAAYVAAVKQLREVYICVAALLFGYGEGFGPEVTKDIVIPTRNSLYAAISPLQMQVTEMIALREANAHSRTSNLRVTLKERRERRGWAGKDSWKEKVENAKQFKFKQIISDLTKARANFWENQDPNARLPMDLLHFYAFVGRAGKFVNEWEKLRQMVLHIKFRTQLGVEALGKKEGKHKEKKNILIENLPQGADEEQEDLPTTVSVQNENQDKILTQEDKGGFFE